MPQSKWNEQFSEHPFTYGKNANVFINEHSNLFSKQANIACFAEGEGRNAVYLATKGHRVTAYDVSDVGLQHAIQLATENNVSIQTKVANLTLPLHVENEYDGAILVFGHVEKEKQQQLFENIFHAVKRGGYVMFEVYSEAQLDYDSGGPGKKDFLYDPSDILQWIEAYHCKHFFYGEVIREEGYRHTGLCHVIQVIIQKQ